MNLNNKKLGMIHLKGINDKAYSKYKAKLDVKPKQSNNLWLQLSIKHTHYDKKQNNQNSNNITVEFIAMYILCYIRNGKHLLG